MKMRQVNFHLYDTLSEGGLQPQLWALQEVMNNSLVSYKDPEYVGLQNIEWWTSTQRGLQKQNFNLI